jgi:hypothetical protein
LTLCDFTHLFFILCGSFRMVDGTLFMFKDEDGTSVEKLTKVHVNTSQKLTRVLCIKKKIIIKLKIKIKTFKNREKKEGWLEPPLWPKWGWSATPTLPETTKENFPTHPWQLFGFSSSSLSSPKLVHLYQPNPTPSMSQISRLHHLGMMIHGEVCSIPQPLHLEPDRATLFLLLYKFPG